MTGLDWDRTYALYKSTIDEYRFTLELGLKRNNASFLISLGFLITASTLYRWGHPYLAACVYVLAALNFFLGALAVHRSHLYYRNARDQMKRLEDELHIRFLGIRTTRGMRDEKRGRPLADFSAALLILAGLFALVAGWFAVHP